jgi:hypothetical protein
VLLANRLEVCVSMANARRRDVSPSEGHTPCKFFPGGHGWRTGANSRFDRER